MVLTPPPTAPSTTDVPDFPSRADAMVAWFATNVSELTAFLQTLGIISAGGGVSTSYLFDNGTADADPGTNKLRFNNATQNAATLVSINLTDANAVNLTAFFATLGLSTSTTNKAQMRFTKLADPTKWLIFKAVSYAATTYGDVTGTVISSSSASPFANGDTIVVNITLVGDKGDNGTLGLGAATPAAGNVVLTNASSALQRVSSSGFGFGATLPDATTMPTLGMPIFKSKNTGEYPMYIADKGGTIRGWNYPGETVSVDLHDKSSTAGLWDVEDAHFLAIAAQYVNTALALGTTPRIQAVSLDSDRVMLLFGDTTCEAVVYTRSTGLFGSPVSVRATLTSGIFYGVLAATNNVLVITDAGTPTTTSLQGVVLSTVAAVITVNTPANPTLAAAATKWAPGIASFNGAFGYSVTRGASGASVLGISVTGTTVAFGTEVQLGAASANAIPAHLYVTGTTLMAINSDNTNMNARSFTIAGNTLTGGTATTQTMITTGFRTLALGARWVALNVAVASSVASLVSLAGTVASSTTVTTGLGAAGVASAEAQAVSTTKVVVSCLNTNSKFLVLTDTAGTISVGSIVTIAGSTVAPFFANSSGTTARFVAPADNSLYSVDCSGATPVITQGNYLGSATVVSNFALSDAYMSQRNYVSLAVGSMNVALPVVNTQTTLLGVTANTHRLLPADFMPCGTVGCVGADATESWVIGPLAAGALIQLVKAATP